MLTDASLISLIVQLIFLVAYVPATYIAYRSVRVPLKRDRARQALTQLGVSDDKQIDETISNAFVFKQYFWPLVIASASTIVLYAITHPYVIRSGLTAGLWEEIANIFGGDPNDRAILVGRFMFYGFIGAYTYTLQLVARRYLAYDLSPNVFIFCASRMILATTVGAVVGVALGTFSRAAGVSFDVNLTTVYVVVFFVGFFPEQGINWITTVAKKTLNQRTSLAKELQLSDIEGLSIWEQGRLRQEGIDNAQNLAMADIARLIMSTAFTMTQIVDWIDQALLLVFASSDQFDALEKCGVRCASSFISVARTPEGLTELAAASKLDTNSLHVLYLSLQAASNVRLITRFQWQMSIDPTRVAAAKDL